MTASCNGCRAMKLETWPNGVTAARCFSDRAPVGRIQHRGRVVELLPPAATAHGMDNLRRITSPVWCPRHRKTEIGEKNGKTEKPPL